MLYEIMSVFTEVLASWYTLWAMNGVSMIIESYIKWCLHFANIFHMRYTLQLLLQFSLSKSLNFVYLVSK